MQRFRSESNSKRRPRKSRRCAAASRRKIDPAKVEKAVAETAEAEAARYNVPLYSTKASPDAQYIARNPESSIITDDGLEARQPKYSNTANRVINSLTADRPQAADPMQEFMEATGEDSTIDYQLTRAKRLQSTDTLAGQATPELLQGLSG